ncbi:MAG: hypothetical protein KGJ35_01910 [Patescibacteria group bacterium]|nr:hypothetical protein [Patescibacteria group bacterium]
MKKYWKQLTILIFVAAVVVGYGATIPNISHAQENFVITSTGGNAQSPINPGAGLSATPTTTPSTVNEGGIDFSSCNILYHFGPLSCMDALIAAGINNIALPIANWALTLSGVVLNAVMIITLNMSSFVSASGGIVDATWTTIRDLSSILIIFFLLYISIRMIIGEAGNTSMQHIIIMVVIAGVLINFSLFFTKFFIDASNLVGLAFYRAIAPSGANINFNQSSNDYISKSFTSGGISDEFMKALSIQNVYAPDAVSSTTIVSTRGQTQSTNPLAIITAGIGGVLIMNIAALSFLGAALLFAVRIGFLIILMAFSPVYFVGWIIPEVKTKMSDRWKNALINQCLILPIYLFFMYVALRVITNPLFKSSLNPGTSGGSANFQLSFVGTIMEYLIALILIIIPLMAAMEFASVGKDLVNKGIGNAKKWGMGAVSGSASSAWRNTGGRLASKAGESTAMKKIATWSPTVGRIASSATNKVAGSYNKARDERQKKDKAVLKNIMTTNRADFAPGEAGEKAYKDAKIRNEEMGAKYLETMRKTTLIQRMTAGISRFGGADITADGLNYENRRAADALQGDYDKAYAKAHKEEMQTEHDQHHDTLKTYQDQRAALVKTKEGNDVPDKLDAQITKHKTEAAAKTSLITKQKQQNADQLAKEGQAFEEEHQANQKKIAELEKETVAGFVTPDRARNIQLQINEIKQSNNSLTSTRQKRIQEISQQNQELDKQSEKIQSDLTLAIETTTQKHNEEIKKLDGLIAEQKKKIEEKEDKWKKVLGKAKEVEEEEKQREAFERIQGEKGKPKEDKPKPASGGGGEAKK